LSESGIKKKEQLASWLVKLFFALCRDFSFKIKMAERNFIFPRHSERLFELKNLRILL